MSLTSLIIDIVLVLIVLFFVIKGYKRGLIIELIGVVAIIIALAGANILATTYASEFSGMLKPFIGGTIDKAVTSTATEDPDGDGLIAEDERGSVYDVTFDALRRIGVSEPSAQKIAEKLDSQVENTVGRIAEQLTDSLCEKLSFVLIFAIVFILLAIIFAAIGNIINLAFNLPGLETVNHVAGAVLGFAKGAVLVLFIACLFRYLGLIVPEEVTEKTILLKLLIKTNILAELIGI